MSEAINNKSFSYDSYYLDENGNLLYHGRGTSFYNEPYNGLQFMPRKNYKFKYSLDGSVYMVLIIMGINLLATMLLLVKLMSL